MFVVSNYKVCINLAYQLFFLLKKILALSSNSPLDTLAEIK